MKQLIIRLGSVVALLAAMGIVAFAGLVTIGHLVAPLVSDYRSEVESALTEVVGQPIKIKALTGRWKGYGPELILRRVSIHSDGTLAPQLELPEVRISVSLIGSLIQGSVTPKSITLIAPQLHINRHLDGSLSIAGISGGKKNRPAVGDVTLPTHFRIKRGKITYNDKTNSTAPVQLSHLTLNLHSTDQRHQLDLSASLSGEKKQELTAALDLRTRDLGDAASWSAKFYVAGDAVPLRQVIDQIPNYSHELPKGSAHFQTWGAINAGKLEAASGIFSINQLAFKIGQERRPLNVKQLEGQFSWKNNSENWTLDLLDLELSQYLKSAQATNIKLVGSEHQLKLAVEQIALDDIASLLPAILPADHSLIKQLASITPKGKLENFRLNVDTDQLEEWQASGQFTNISSTPWQNIPGIEQLSTSFWASANQVQLEIDDQDVVVKFTELFRDPLQLTKLQGSLYWKQESDGSWVLSSDNLVSNTPDIQLITRLLLKQPTELTDGLFLDLQTDFRDGDSTKTSRYLPVSIMGKEVVAWIDRSIGSGHVPDGSVIVRGSLADFPYAEKENGRFEVFFRTENLNLDYWPEWPELNNIFANVRFLNNRFDVWVEKATIFNSQVKSAHGQIKDLALTSPFELTGLVEGPLTDNLKLLAESPLKEDFGPIVTHLDGSNNTRLAIDFAVPIEDKGKQRLKGQLTFLKSKLDLKNWQLAIDHISGDLHFGLTGIQGEALTGQLLGSTIQIDVDTPKGKPNYTRITTKGDIPSELLQQRFSEISLLQRMEGSSNWSLELDIPHIAAGINATTQVRAFSDLKGVQVNAPKPFGKETSSQRSFELKTAFDGQAEQQYELNFDTIIKANLFVVTDNFGLPELAAVSIALGDNTPAPLKNGEVEISGHLDKLELDAWVTELEGQSSPNTNLSLSKLNLQLGQLQFKQSILNDVNLTLQRLPSRWDLVFDSDRARGRALIPSDLETDPIKISLDQLKVNFDPEAESLDEPSSAVPNHSLHPTNTPAIAVTVKQLSINDHPFGQLELITKKVLSGLEITRFNLDSKFLKIDAEGDWKLDDQGHQRTTLNTKISTPSTGELLGKLGYTKNLKGAPLELEAALGWPYTPIDVNRRGIAGQASFQVGKGQFLEVDPGVGRIFGLLNLSALQRRLTLDFSDIFAKGFAFDSIESSFVIDSGDAYTNDFSIVGPAANIDISGRIGLADKDLDQQITLTPKISSTLPLAGALAGGPAVGAALFLAQAILGDSLDKITHVKYSAVGPWDNPTFTKHQPEPSKRRDRESSFDPRPQPADGETWQLPSPHSDDQYPLAEEYQPQPEKAAEPSSTPLAESTADHQTDNTSDNQPKESGSLLNLLEKLKPTGQKYESDSDNDAFPAQ